MKEIIRERLERAVSEHVFPGGVVGVSTVGKKFVIPVGKLTYDRTAPSVTEETVYDIASVTKAVPVSSLMLQLLDEKKVSLTDKAVTYLPELKNTRFCSDVLIHHYMTMTLDYHTPLASLKERSPEEIIAGIFSTKFRYKPGAKMNYSNAASIVLGLIIERVTGKRLDRVADERFFRPLRMRNTTFHPEIIQKERIAPTEDDPWRGRIIQGEIHDESAYLLREKMIAGSAGVFSTAPDILKFLQMLINEGDYEGKQYFSKKMISKMQENQLEIIGETASLGWELHQPRFMGEFATKKTIGKTGFTGCMVMCDIPKEKGIVILSNYHFPKRKESFAAINEVRRDIADIVFSSSE